MVAKPIPPLTPDEVTRFFWVPLDKSGECWVWLGQRSGKAGGGKDYGQFAIYRDGKRRTLYAHRVALTLLNGVEPEMACHHCDNPPCVRPSHLYAGSAKSNAQDAIERGRKVQGLGRKRPDLTQRLLVALIARGGMGAAERSDDLSWQRAIDRLDAADDVARFEERILHGDSLPELIA